MERNTLMAKCYPKIKDYCREKHGLEFQVIPFPFTCNFFSLIEFHENFILKGKKQDFSLN